MRPLSALLAALAALALGPAAAPGSGGPLIPAGVYGAGGVTVPGSEFRYSTVFGGEGGVIEKIRTDGGSIKSYRGLHGGWSLPAVTILGQAGGLSADGDTLVMIKPPYETPGPQTQLLVLDTKGLNTEEHLTLDGRFSFDAISPDGRLLYLVEYPNPRDPLDYRVRAYDRERGGFRPGRIVDPEEPGERMTGQPVSRQASPDGRWAYTLYGGGEETFIHALDTTAATAVCVDLEQIPARDLYLLGLSVDPATGAITVLRKREPVAVVDPHGFTVSDPAAAAEGGDGPGPPWALLATALGLLAIAGAALVLRIRSRARAPGAGGCEPAR